MNKEIAEIENISVLPGSFLYPFPDNTVVTSPMLDRYCCDFYRYRLVLLALKIYVGGIRQCVFTLSGSFYSTWCSKFIHVTVCVYSNCFFVSLNSILLYKKNLLIRSPPDAYLGCFQLGAVLGGDRGRCYKRSCTSYFWEYVFVTLR